MKWSDNVESMKKGIEQGLPEIEGVTWELDIYEKCASDNEIGVSLVANFDVYKNTMSRNVAADIASSILSKIHEITSKGQVLLELEK